MVIAAANLGAAEPTSLRALDLEIATAMRMLAAALDDLGHAEHAATTRELARDLVNAPGNRSWYRALCWARDRWTHLGDRPTPDVQSYRASLLAWGVRGMLLRRDDQRTEARARWREQLAAATELDPLRAPEPTSPRTMQLPLPGLGGAP